MLRPNEVFFEPLVSNGSNYASWSAHVLNAFRTMGPTVERILIASILPPKFDIDHIDWANITQEELDCTQLNACVTNFLRCILCEDIQDAIFKMKERNTSRLQEVSKSAERCTTSSEIEPQKTASKIQEGKYSVDTDLTFAVVVPGGSGSGRETERHRPSEESTSASHSSSHLDHHQCFMAIHEDELHSDSDSDDEELVDELRKMSNRNQEIERQEKLLSDKDEEIKSLALVEKKNQAITAQVDELTSKCMDLQAYHMELKCSNDMLVESYAVLEIAHEVVIAMMKSCQPINNTFSQNGNKEKQSWFEQVTIEDCNDNLVQENEVHEQEVERLSKDLTKMKGKSVVQPSQDNRETMVKKLENGSTVQSSCNQVHKSNKSKRQAKKKNLDHIKCFNCSNIGIYASMYSIKLEGQQTLSKRQRSLAKRRCFGCCKKGHKIATCPSKSNMLSSKTGSSVFAKSEVSDLAVQHRYKLNKGFKRAQAQYLERKAVRNNESKLASNLKHKVCYTCRGKGHLGKDCPNGNTSKPNLVNNRHVLHRRSHNGACAGRMIKSSTIRTKAV
ncbi:hypothetical protein GQ55_1G148700 [Panicum hallii var. hallii]|uniref:CCHC-type domain-containing protein n=1 Tax=Panicum hallii var. hallii TaxID=1504633 RepID=A0A2T7F5D8_9POAL|nr:hypothetical protein GQ55_1G148700 [Panicum hallii var. hallii]